MKGGWEDGGVATLLSVNVGAVQDAPYANLGHSGMDKRPVTGRVAARTLGRADPSTLDALVDDLLAEGS